MNEEVMQATVIVVTTVLHGRDYDPKRSLKIVVVKLSVVTTLVVTMAPYMMNLVM